jgi:RNA polymerase sigma factor (sigma-70 family)
MIDSGSIDYIECERRLNNLYHESHNWLLQAAKKITKNIEEAEDMVQELYLYLHQKCNPKLFFGEDTYNLYYCSKFLHSRFINKTKKLNRTTYVEDIWDIEVDIEYDIERDKDIEKAHQQVLDELRHLSRTKMWASAKIFELYWMSDKTLDEVARDIKISKSTTFLAVKKIRQHLKEVINNPYNEN